MRALGQLVRHARAHGYDDDETERLITRRLPEARIPADPRERRKAFNRWEDALDPGDAAWFKNLTRGEQRRAAVEALRHLERPLVNQVTAGRDELTRLEALLDAWTRAAAAGVPGGRRKGDPLRVHLAGRVAALRAEVESDEMSIPLADRGTYAVEGVLYTARPVNVRRLMPGDACRWDETPSQALDRYLCGCSACRTFRTDAMLLGAEARNRPQPWHPRRPGRGSLVAVASDSWDELAFRAVDRTMRAHAA